MRLIVNAHEIFPYAIISHILYISRIWAFVGGLSSTVHLHACSYDVHTRHSSFISKLVWSVYGMINYRVC